jgi:hypothetical protein
VRSTTRLAADPETVGAGTTGKTALNDAGAVDLAVPRFRPRPETETCQHRFPDLRVWGVDPVTP